MAQKRARVSYPPLPYTPASAFKCFGKASNLELSPEGGESFLWGKGGKDISVGGTTCAWTFVASKNQGLSAKLNMFAAQAEWFSAGLMQMRSWARKETVSSSKEGCI